MTAEISLCVAYSAGLGLMSLYSLALLLRYWTLPRGSEKDEP